jgi:hypothetical protein
MQRAAFIMMTIAWSQVGAGAGTARGDGGALRLSQRQDAYWISVFTSPTPFRAGLVDVSVLVQDAATGVPLPMTQVTVRLARFGQPQEAVSYPATMDAATNKLMQAAVFELSEAGRWEFEVVVAGDAGSVHVRFDLEAAERLPDWLAIWPWISWPALAVGLFGIHQWLVWRRTRSDYRRRLLYARASAPGAPTP